MSIPQLLVIFSAFISVGGAIPYIRDTYRGKTQPNRISWFMWAFAPMIAISAAIAADADVWATFRIFLAGLLPLIVFLTSFFNPNSYWKLSIFDFLCGAFSVFAIVIWFSIQSPQYAILLTVIADAFAGLPTIYKAWKYPATETGITFMTNLISVLLVIPSIPVWNIENSAFQIFLIIQNSILILGIYRKRIFTLFT